MKPPSARGTHPLTTNVAERAGDVAMTLSEQVAETRSWLEDLVRIPSVSSQAEHWADCRAAAERSAELLGMAGLSNVRTLTVAGGHPYVLGSWLDAGEDAPTVLLYAHHDVQPPGNADRWSSPPFEPEERGGRLFGRGAADDKAGILVHVAAVRAWLSARGSLPLNVRVLLEGEEEIGSPGLQPFLEEHGDGLSADAIVVTDLTNWKVGWPGLTYALRGSVKATMTVKTLAQPVHSGLWGGVVPDAFSATAVLLASLFDGNGGVAVPDFYEGVRQLSPSELARLQELDADPEEFRKDVQMLEGVELIGDGRFGLLERLWMQPTLTPIGIDVPDPQDASNTLLAKVRTRLSCRLAPGQEPARVVDALQKHLETHVPWGAHVELSIDSSTPGWVSEPEGPAWEAAEAAMLAAYGRPPAAMGCGGSIPMVQALAERFPDTPLLLTGVEDPATNAHGEDESLHLDDFSKACLAEAYLLAELADRLG